jgi:hypothetical protein
MPVLKCPNGKYRIGKGPCMYTSKEKAESAYKGYLGSKYGQIVFSVLKKIERKSPRMAVRINTFLEKQANKEMS